ncbi:MAG TPA: hypothetical protein VNZ58_14000 [Thermomicrobiales bacterium]|nr:hypothetical protein [Thermomicrobiales bacterium]
MMNLKRNFIAIIVAGGFTAGLASGALAAVGDTDVTVILEDAASTSCQAAFTEGTFDLGTWTWDPEADLYVLDAGSSSSDTGVVDVTVGRTGAAIGNEGGDLISCQVDLTLEAPSNGAITIALANFSAEVSMSPLTGTSTTVPANGVLGSETLTDDGTINVGLQLSNPGNIPSGTYTGSITVLAADQTP